LMLSTRSAGPPYTGISPSLGRYLHTGQHIHRLRAYIHPYSGIRTHDPSICTGEDNPCLRPHDRCERLNGHFPLANQIHKKIRLIRALAGRTALTRWCIAQCWNCAVLEVHQCVGIC
jgi:hypothetical protein